MLCRHSYRSYIGGNAFLECDDLCDTFSNIFIFFFVLFRFNLDFKRFSNLRNVHIFITNVCLCACNDISFDSFALANTCTKLKRLYGACVTLNYMSF